MDSGANGKWSTEETCKLIELYREYSLLWDPTCIYYKNKFKKADAFKAIGNLLNVTQVEVDRKLRNTNSQFFRQRRVYEKMRKSGVGKQFHAK